MRPCILDGVLCANAYPFPWSPRNSVPIGIHLIDRDSEDDSWTC